MTTRRGFIRGVFASVLALVIPRAAAAMPINEPDTITAVHVPPPLLDNEGLWVQLGGESQTMGPWDKMLRQTIENAPQELWDDCVIDLDWILGTVGMPRGYIGPVSQRLICSSMAPDCKITFHGEHLQEQEVPDEH